MKSEDMNRPRKLELEIEKARLKVAKAVEHVF
jgi:hypothetical protein